MSAASGSSTTRHRAISRQRQNFVREERLLSLRDPSFVELGRGFNICRGDVLAVEHRASLNRRHTLISGVVHDIREARFTVRFSHDGIEMFGLENEGFSRELPGLFRQ